MPPLVDPQIARSLRRHRRRAAALVSRHRVALGLGVAASLAAVAWVLALPHNPPCCYNDEASTNYNAWLISQTGRDEYGASWPLYFRAFGEFRSSAQIYALAGLFKLFGPHLLLARYLTRAAMFLAVLIVGWLAWRISGRRSIGVAVAGLGLTTPMLYEVSRLGTEGPLMNLPIAAFLAGVFLAQRRGRWPLWVGPVLAVPLAALAYTYPAGRPLAPLLGAGLVLFWGRERWRSMVLGWLTLVVLLAPIAVFMVRHPGALTGYPGALTWYDSSQLPFEALWLFVAHVVQNLDPRSVLIDGDPNVRHHIGPVGAVLLPMWLLSVAGLVVVLLRHRRDSWWRYVLFAGFALLIPASLTTSVLHTPRLIALPLPALLLCVPALQALRGVRWRRAAVTGLVVVSLAETGLFVNAYVRDGTDAERVAQFQGDFLDAFRVARETGQRPIWLLDVASTHGFWQGVIDGLPRREMVLWQRPQDPYRNILPKPDAVQFVPPPGAVVIAGEQPCATCRQLFQGPNYTVWIQG